VAWRKGKIEVGVRMSELSQYQQEEGTKPSPETFLPEPGGHIKVTSGIK